MNNLRIEDYGYKDFFRRQKDDLDRSGELVVARVTQVHRESYTVVSEMGEKMQGSKARSSSAQTARRLIRPREILC